MKSIEMIVPRMLIKYHLPHPEEYGESLVELLNGMITDVFTNDDGVLITMTNNTSLIEYLKQNDTKETHYQLRDQSINLVTINQSYLELVFKWMNKDIKENEIKYSPEDIRLYISHAITFNSHLFVVSKENLPIGLVGYNIIHSVGIINYKFFDCDNFTVSDEDSVLKLLLNHIKQVQAITSFKALVPTDDFLMNQVYQRNNFIKEDTAIENHLEYVYQFTQFALAITAAEKEVLNEFLSLYPQKLYDLANPDELIDLEHAIDYSLKIYARLILSKQLDQRDEFGDIFINADGCLSIEDNLIEKYDEMMQHIDGEDFKVAKDYKDLIFAVLEIINRRIKHYQNLELHILVEHNSK